MGHVDGAAARQVRIGQVGIGHARQRLLTVSDDHDRPIDARIDAADPLLFRHGWCRGAFVLFFPAALFAMFRGLGAHDARRGLVALYLWSMVLVAMLFFGSGRIRLVHDAVMIALAVDAWARLVAWLRARKRHSCAAPTAAA